MCADRPLRGDEMNTNHDDFGGLERDLPMLLQRRHVLKLLAGGSLLALVSCGSDNKQSATTSAGTSPASTSGSTSSSATTIATADSAATTTAATASAGTSSTAACTPINEETAGPYPGDGSNGPAIPTESGIVRRDITSSF